MNKKKDFSLPHSDIHTIVDLPIEAVIHHIMSLNPKDYQVEISQDSSDKVDFRIRNKVGKNRLKIDTKGTIRRWNGTLTRLDANYHIRFTRWHYRLYQGFLWIISWVLGGGYATSSQESRQLRFL